MQNRILTHTFGLLSIHFLLSLSPYAQAEGLHQERTWTSSDNKTLKATLLSANEEQVILRLSNNGRRIPLPLSRLVEADQKAVQSWLEDFPYGVAPPIGPFIWPSRYSGSQNEKAEYLRYDAETEAHIFQTKHFEVHSTEKLSPATISRCTDVFESVSGALDILPIQLDSLPPENERYKVILVSTGTLYSQAGGPPGSAGFYSPSRKITVIPYKSLGIIKKGNNWVFDGSNRSFKTLIHELVHQCTPGWATMPVWFQEGLADFMEAMPYRSGQFLFTNPGAAIVANVRGNYHLKSKYYSHDPFVNHFQKEGLAVLQLEKLTSISRRAWNERLSQPEGHMQYTSSMVLFWYFLCEDATGDGTHFIEWCHQYRNAWTKSLLAKKTFDPSPINEKYLLRGRTWEKVRQDLADKAKKKGLRISGILEY